MPSPPASRPRRTQADRREQTRAALLEAAARGISAGGYRSLVLERVASDAGFTRGALYHHFADKEELALAVVGWGLQTWREEVGARAARESDPLAALLTLARAHAVYCRRDVARLMMTLRVEVGGQNHPVGQAVDAALAAGLAFVEAFIDAARAGGSIPDGPPTTVLAVAYVGALEGLMIGLVGRRDHDEVLAERVARGVLGLDATAKA